MKVRDAAVDVGAADRRSVSVLLGFGCAVLWDSVTINNCGRLLFEQNKSGFHR